MNSMKKLFVALIAMMTVLALVSCASDELETDPAEKENHRAAEKSNGYEEPYVELIKRDIAATNAGDFKEKWDCNWLFFEGEEFFDREEYENSKNESGDRWTLVSIDSVEHITSEGSERFYETEYGGYFRERVMRCKEKGLLEESDISDIYVVRTTEDYRTETGTLEEGEYDFSYIVCKCRGKWVIGGYED